MNTQPISRTRYAPGWADARPSAVAFGVVLVVLCLAQLTVLVVTMLRAPSIPVVLVVVPVLAVVVGVLRFRDGVQGPDIHDRQLDRIIGSGAAAAAATLLALTTPDQQRIEFLALPATVVAVLVSKYGTRRLWQLRAAPLKLLLLWPAPWTALEKGLQAHVPATVLQGAVAGVLIAAPLALAARGHRRRRILAVPVAALGGAAAAELLTVVDPTVATPAVTATVILTTLLVLVLVPARLLTSTGWSSTPEPV